MLVKFASAQVLEARKGKHRRMRKQSHRARFDYEPREGFIYVRSRMISSRCNDNFDEFPADEIRKGWRSFIGKPVFVNHHNDDHRESRGVIIDAALHEDKNPDNTDDVWVEGLMEVDAVKYPLLTQALLAGDIDRTSMGTDVKFSVCSFCGNKASTPLDYCRHIPAMKGQRIRRTTASGKTEDHLVREICHGLHFFENSLLVEDPADPTAHFLGLDDRGVGGGYRGDLKAAATRRTAVEWNHSVKDVRWDADVDGVTVEVRRRSLRGPYEWSTSDGSSGTEPTLQQAKDAAETWVRWLKRESTIRTARRYEVIPDRTVRVGGEWVRVNTYGVFDHVTGEWVAQGRTQAEAEAIAADWTLDPYMPGSPVNPKVLMPMAGSRRTATRRTAGSPTLDGAIETARQNIPISRQVKADPQGFVIHDAGGDFRVYDAEPQAPGGFMAPGERSGTPVARVDMNGEVTMLASRRQAAQPQTAPAAVDTLREAECPVCGEEDSFDGEHCQVCGYDAPPEEFRDPDTSKAQDVDLGNGDAGTADPVEYGQHTTPEERIVRDHPADDFTEPDRSNYPPETSMGEPAVEEQQPGEDEEVAGVEEGEDVEDPALTEEQPVDEEGNPIDPVEDALNQTSPEDAALLSEVKTLIDEVKQQVMPDELSRSIEEEVAEGIDELRQMIQQMSDGEVAVDPAVAEDGEEAEVDEDGNPIEEAVEESEEGEVPDFMTSDDEDSGDEEASEDEGSDDEESESEDEDDEDDDDDEDKNPFAKKKSRRTVTHSNSPNQGVRTSSKEIRKMSTLKALAEATQLLGAQQQIIRAQARQISVQQRQIDYIGRVAGIEGPLRRLAEADNPAQPIEEPSSEAPADTTENARGNPQGTLEEEGAVPGTTDVSADTTTDVESIGTELTEETQLDGDQLDVTAPVNGTTDKQPIGDVRTETDVRVKDGVQEETMFPIDDAFSERMTTGGSKESRLIAAMRLSRLRIEAGISDDDDDLTGGDKIASSDMSDSDIQHEIETLSKIKTSAASRQPGATPEGARRLVPRHAAGVAPAAASMASAPMVTPGEIPSRAPGGEEFLFD